MARASLVLDHIGGGVHLIELAGVAQGSRAENSGFHQFVAYEVEPDEKHPILDQFWANQHHDLQLAALEETTET